MRIRPMRHVDVEPVLGILRGSFAPDLTRYMTRTQRGAGALFHAILDNHHLVPAIDLSVVVDRGDTPLAFAEFSPQAGAAHLSYVCVAEGSRRRGLATALIGAHVERERPAAVSLDVFADNTGARRLYEGLGFTVRDEHVWLNRALPNATEPSTVSNGYEAMAMHVLFGFCTLQVRWEGQPAQVGWLADGVLRCTDERSFGDDRFLASMRATVPGATEALVIAPRSTCPSDAPVGTRVLATALRMVRDTPQDPSEAPR